MKQQWWHGKVAYQIYPKSFQDSNQDGIGDLKGIISRLEYLHDLGVEIIWISPIYVSPFEDQGYDIANYQDIDPIFGDLATFDELLAKAQKLNMNIIMDLVVNHCSKEHEWFKKACADPKSEEASYFYFIKGKNGQRPNNLRSHFGGSIWDLVPGQQDLYYCHFFAKGQPDLNWFNPKLREKIYTMINWWLDKGIAGFRIDAIMCIQKDLNFPDYPEDGEDHLASCTKMYLKPNSIVNNFLQELKAKTFDKYQAFTVGEAFGVQSNDLADFIGANGNFSTIFDFAPREYIASYSAFYGYEPINIATFRDLIFNTQISTNNLGFVAPVIENHDEPRGVSTYLPVMWQNAQGAKSLATIFLMLRGIPFIYQGQELGMTNTYFKNIDEFNDLQSHDEYQKCLQHGLTNNQALEILNHQARDQGRTPMLWDDSTNAGFTTATPWMKIHQDYKKLNVKAQLADENSVLNYYKKLIKLKKDPRFSEILTYGSFVPLENTNGSTIAFLRQLPNKTLMIAANFGKEAITLVCKDHAQILIANYEAAIADNHIKIPAGAAIVIKLR